MTTLVQLKANLAVQRNGMNALVTAIGKANALLRKIEGTVNSPDQFRSTLTDADADVIANNYTPVYIAALTDIEKASDMLGTDQLN